jgi:hypothetical protein
MSIKLWEGDTKAFGEDQQRSLIRAMIWPCCLNCAHWGSNDLGNVPPRPDLCYKFNAMPPPDVIVIGCGQWLSAVPF